ncbi:long-chain-fatty-acid--CoA ligase [Nakamurella lactea]|uniref:long-chain-fatty-acid--CoA ligase n=1 Tax=Nakamurella lactea TaxID=459515 RepID=UPI0003FFA811|nr:long-chain-fatty-acid--CoA ligase [Nakamurella lactea]
MLELTYPRMLVGVTDRTPDATAVICDDGSGYRATFAQHLDRVLRLKSALRQGLGVAADERFAVLAGNSHRFLELWHTAAFGTAVINPLNTRLAPAELEFILGDSNTDIVFTDRTFAPVVDQLRSRVGIKKVVLLDDSDSPHDMRYEDLLAAHEPAAPDEPDENDDAVLMYTGGTTGLPKGVLLSLGTIARNVYHLDYAYRILTNHDVYLVNTPMFHAAGCFGVFGIPAAGSTNVIQPTFDAGRTIAAADEYGVSIVGVVASMLGMIMDHGDFAPEKFSRLRIVGYGGSPLPSSIQSRFMRYFPAADMMQLYGMTEGSATVTCLTPADHRAGGARIGSVGRAIPGVRVQIHDPDTDELLPTGSVGEIVMKSSVVMKEYWNRPPENAKALRDGWYHTGDAGYLDDEGYLFITDRVKDMIISGGENVYSVEVENALAAHPAVAQVAVIGIPSEQWGEAVHAVVYLRPGENVTQDELKDHARQSLAGYKVPKSVDLRTEPLPMSAAMKILKRELREPFWAGRERRI